MAVAAAIYYMGIFEFDSLCQIISDEPWQLFKLDMLRAFGLIVVFSTFNQFYWVSKDKKDLEVFHIGIKEGNDDI